MNLLNVFLAPAFPPNACRLSPGEGDNFTHLGTVHGNYVRVESPDLLNMMHVYPNEELWAGIHLVESPPFTDQMVFVLKQQGRGVIAWTTREFQHETDKPLEIIDRALEVYGAECHQRENLEHEVRLRACNAPLAMAVVAKSVDGYGEITSATLLVTSDEAAYTNYLARISPTVPLAKLVPRRRRHVSVLEQSAEPLYAESPDTEARTAKSLSFSMQCQQQSNWCWLAVATSVAQFYEAGSSAWTQCTLANAMLGRGDCCQGISGACSQAEVSADCNVQGTLDGSLEQVRHLKGPMSGKMRFTDLTQEIDAGRPTCIRIYFPGAGHFVALTGYASDGEPTLDVQDPFHGSSTVPFTLLDDGLYQGTGTWTHTYTTKE